MLLCCAAQARVPQDMGMEVDLLVVGKSGVGLGGDCLQGRIDILSGQSLP